MAGFRLLHCLDAVGKIRVDLLDTVRTNIKTIVLVQCIGENPSTIFLSGLTNAAHAAMKENTLNI